MACWYVRIAAATSPPDAQNLLYGLRSAIPTALGSPRTGDGKCWSPHSLSASAVIRRRSAVTWPTMPDAGSLIRKCEPLHT